MNRWPAALAMLTVLGSGCSSDEAPQAPSISASAAVPTAMTTTSAAIAPPVSRPPVASATPTWVVGASPLPVGPDGFGLATGTPAALRTRTLQQPDVLPPPTDGRFRSTVGPVTPAIRSRMGTTYAAGCPVPLADLRYLTLVFRGFDGAAHTGELVVAAKAADKTVRAFRRLFEIGFPLEEMRLPGTADLTATPTGDGNDTAAFVCRTARGQSRFSAHAFGLAIDVNPFQNPFVRGPLVLPELAGAYVDRTRRAPGMLLPGSSAVRAFTDQGFTWGGTFRRPKDYQHMSLTGN